MNESIFFQHVRKLAGKLNQKQVDGFSLFIDSLDFDTEIDRQKAAYILATCWHETAHTMQPIEEYGRGRGRTYGNPDKLTAQTYYGRGYVQLTWKGNYQKMSKILGIDLVYNPQLALNPKIAMDICIKGMNEGLFTGKKLEDYFTPQKCDWLGARFIINGKRSKSDKYADCAEKIRDYAVLFYDAINASLE